jgi:hypothetical protein
MAPDERGLVDFDLMMLLSSVFLQDRLVQGRAA